MLAEKLSGGAAPAVIYVDDVFSTWLYTGNSSTQTITNGINLSAYGGLVWGKSRSGAYNHELVDTARGAGNALRSNQTAASTTSCDVNSFTTTGFTLNSAGGGEINTNTVTEVAWTFRKAAKFFDVVTYTGTGVARTVSHSLGSTPGCIIVKCTTTGATNWRVYHNGLTSSAYTIQLDQTNAQSNQTSIWNSTAPTASSFTVGTDPSVNSLGDQYVAYIFAHNAGGFGASGTDNVISCGSYTGSNGAGQSIDVGFEPQWLLVKNTSRAGQYWVIMDNMRQFDNSGYGWIYPNSSAAETAGTGSVYCSPTATGFKTVTTNAAIDYLTDSYIYIAIRRPNKPPTTGTQVYNAIARTGTGAAATVTGVGFSPDLVLSEARGSQNPKAAFFDRLRGATKYLVSAGTGGSVTSISAEQTDATTLTAFGMDGYSLGAETANVVINGATTYINWNFRRAPGFFDVVCYTGTGSATTQAHNLGVAPELMIVKRRNGAAEDWYVYHSAVGNGWFLNLDLTATPTSSGQAWNNTTPTSTVFTVGNLGGTNSSTNTFVNYIFATLAGISKVGSYTGNGSSQTINCGFAAGARFILIKRTDSTGDWYVWDSARGIVSGDDPHLSLNTTAAEVTTDDSIDPDSTGFIVNQLGATNINVNTATYIYLAIAQE